VLDLDGGLGAYDLPEDGKVFTNPKPVRLFTSFFPFLLKKDGHTVLDFFAGSGATAKAVFQLNAADAVQRRVILVQLVYGGRLRRFVMPIPFSRVTLASRSSSWHRVTFTLGSGACTLAQ